jgi:hypothetical protein
MTVTPAPGFAIALFGTRWVREPRCDSPRSRGTCNCWAAGHCRVGTGWEIQRPTPSQALELPAPGDARAFESVVSLAQGLAIC